MNNWLSSQLNITDHTGQESPDLKRPPLQTEHQHAGDGHLDELAPFLQTVQRPTWRADIHKLGNIFELILRCDEPWTLHWRALTITAPLSFYNIRKIHQNSYVETLKRENSPDQVSLCNPIKRMKKYKSSASDNCETAFAAADPL